MRKAAGKKESCVGEEEVVELETVFPCEGDITSWEEEVRVWW